MHAVQHVTEAPVHINYQREATASIWVWLLSSGGGGGVASGVPRILRSTAVVMQLLHQCLGSDVALKLSTIGCGRGYHYVLGRS